MRKVVLSLILLFSAWAAIANPSVNSAVNSVVALDVRVPGGGSYCAGFIYKPGIVVTAAHCLENATFIRVFFRDGSFDIAKIVGLDVSADVGVLRLVSQKGLPVTLRMSLPAIAEDVYAIGHPKKYAWTITKGVVSRTDAPAGTYDATYGIASNLIQTDALAFHGSSGGVLVSTDGRVVGMIAGVGSLAFVTLVVPSSLVMEQAERILK